MKLPAALSSLALLLFAGAALAQPVYRSVDKSGKTVFTDQPSVTNAAPAGGGAVSTTGGGAPLPYELRQVVQRYPVTLYAGADCAPCGAARSLLTTRGVPFDERTIKSNEDIAALQRLSGQTGLPLLTIGAQQVKGFSDSEWSQYLDAAGYPKSSQLPAGYSNPPAQPLVAQQQAAVPAPAAAAPAASSDLPPAPSGGPTPSNPAGIKF
ncbi:MAG TPA: glutaredoxin family protein [Variovorax sp.]